MMCVPSVPHSYGFMSLKPTSNDVLTISQYNRQPTV
jgi:hypothetical protein